MQGRMEYGPRALGSRSIIADPRSPSMQKKLNLKTKYRESFRSFAPSIMQDKLQEWFDLDCESPYMLLVADILEEKKIKVSNSDQNLFGIEKLNIARSIIPAVTHVDFTARIQTVNEDTNEFYYKLLSEFNNLTNCPILIKTSFNVRGEPIVCNPSDALNCFIGTEINILIIENFILYKNKQSKNFIKNQKLNYKLD